MCFRHIGRHSNNKIGNSALFLDQPSAFVRFGGCNCQHLQIGAKKLEYQPRCLHNCHQIRAMEWIKFAFFHIPVDKICHSCILNGLCFRKFSFGSPPWPAIMSIIFL